MSVVTAPHRRWYYVAACLVAVISALGCRILSPPAETPSAGSAEVPFEVTLNHPENTQFGGQVHTLIQQRNPAGIVTGYSMAVNSVYCKDDVCQVVPVTMYWDAVGDYQKLSLEPGQTLEKLGAQTDENGSPAGEPFSQPDYDRLHDILTDRYSLLRTQNYKNLASARQGNAVDAMTGATPQSLKDAVVEGAALTCYNLWHWANGDVVPAIKSLTRQQCDDGQLLYFLASESPQYTLFALDHLASTGALSPAVKANVVKHMRSTDLARFKLGYACLQKAMPDTAAFHKQLATLFVESDSQSRIHLLGILADEKTLSPDLLDAMADALPKMSRFYEVQLYLSLLTSSEHSSKKILHNTGQLLASSNFFVARRAYSFLKNNQVGSELQAQLIAFEERCRKEGRLLPQ